MALVLGHDLAHERRLSISHVSYAKQGPARLHFICIAITTYASKKHQYVSSRWPTASNAAPSVRPPLSQPVLGAYYNQCACRPPRWTPAAAPTAVRSHACVSMCGYNQHCPKNYRRLEKSADPCLSGAHGGRSMFQPLCSGLWSGVLPSAVSCSGARRQVIDIQ